MEGLGLRKAELTNMTEMAGYLRMEFVIPARGLIGFRNQFLTDTKGNGVMNHVSQVMLIIKVRSPDVQEAAWLLLKTAKLHPTV